MSLLLIGVNHRTAPVDIRERLSVSQNDAPSFLSDLRHVAGVRGAAVLSTCNRVEVLVSGGNEAVTDPVVEHLAQRAELDRHELEKHLYIMQNRDVVRHLFRVTSGLDSMILGEPQIAGQVHTAYQIAKDAGGLDPLLQGLYENTFRVAKRVRSETGIGENAVSIPYAAVELAKKIFGELDKLQVMLVGAGDMGELTAQHLQGSGLRKVFVANRAYERAKELAERFEGEAVHFDAVPEQLRTCDIVVVSTAAPHYVVRKDQVEAALDSRRRRDLFLIDLSVPRNIDPEVADLEGAYLYNIDDLQQVANANLEKRQKKALVAEDIIGKEVDGFLAKLATQDAIPTIVELQTRLEEIRRNELEKCLRKMGPIPAEQRQIIEMLTTGIINKVLHYPIIRLKESAADAQPTESERLRETIRTIFGLR